MSGFVRQKILDREQARRDAPKPRQRLATRSKVSDRDTSTCLLCREPIFANAGLWQHSTTFVNCDKHKQWKEEFE